MVINAQCQLRKAAGQRVVIVHGIPFMHFADHDRAGAAHAMVMLVHSGLARQNQVASAFAVHVRTVRRLEARFAAGGLAALVCKVGYPKGRARNPPVDRRVIDLKAEGHTNREIARQLGCCEKAVRKRLRRLGFRPQVAEQLSLPEVSRPSPGADPNLSGLLVQAARSAACEYVESADPKLSALPTGTPSADDALSLDTDPTDRRLDRLLAWLGLIDDAKPIFGNARAVPNAGVLLALPPLLETGVFEVADEVWGAIGPAFYGLRTVFVTMLFMALMRIKRPEALKEHVPESLGSIIGLDRAPEVKTLRRKLTRLAAMGGAELFGQRLAQRRVQTHGQTLGFLYIDGHVRIYYGRRRIPKTYAARLNAITKATTDYWVNDSAGDPLFVVTAAANASTSTMLPVLLDDVRRFIGQRRATIVFDRGGYSPKLFVELIAKGFDIITYRKGRCRKVARRHFKRMSATIDGQTVEHVLADQPVRLLKGALAMRQVTCLTNDHQTHILTNRRDLSALEVAYRMFDRWRQENFFKYLREEYALDVLVDYDIEPDDPLREVPNPKRAKAKAQFEELREQVQALHSELMLARARENLGDKPTADTERLTNKVASEILKLAAEQRRLRQMPSHVPVAQTTTDEVIKLSTQKKHLTNVIKLVSYQAESELLRIVAPHYRRADDEGRTLVHSALKAAGDITVGATELLVTLAPLSSQHRSKALAALCDALNSRSVMFPGTRLRVRYAVAGCPPEAAAGPSPEAKPDIS